MRYEGQKNPNTILLLDRYQARKTQESRLNINEWLIRPEKFEDHGHVLSKISGQKNLNICSTYESGQENPRAISPWIDTEPEKLVYLDFGPRKPVYP